MVFGEKIKKEDLCIIPCWMPTVKVRKESNGKEFRRLKPTEIIVLAKLYGFSGTQKGECNCQEGYLATWANVSRRTITTVLSTFEENNLIKTDTVFDIKENKRKSKYKINKKAFQKYIDNFEKSGSLVKKDQSIIINKDLLIYQVKHNLKSHKFLLHALINRFSMNGFKVSRSYIQNWMGEVNKEGISRHLRDLVEDKLIEFNELKHNSRCYVTTYSKSHPMDWKMLNSSKWGGEKLQACSREDDFSSQKNGEFFHEESRILPEVDENSSQLKNSKNSKEKVVSREGTPLSWMHCLSSVISLYEGKEKYKEDAWVEFVTGKSFKAFLKQWCEEHSSLSREDFDGFIKYLFSKFLKRQNATPNLFRHMMENDLSEYLFKKAPKEEETKNIKEKGICPCCGHYYFKNGGYGKCSECNLEEEDMNNKEAIENAKRYYFATDEERKLIDEENQKAMDNVFGAIHSMAKI